MTPIAYIRIEADVLRRADLSDKAKMLLGLVTSMNGQGVMLSNRELAGLLCAHPNHVTRILRELLDKNLIRVTNAQSQYRRMYLNTGAEVEAAALKHRRLSGSGALKHRRLSGSGALKRRRLSTQAQALDITKGTKRGEDSSRETDLRTFADYWNSKDNLPEVRALSKERQRHFTARTQEPLFAEHWREVIDKVSASAFCAGRNKRAWKADLDWILKNGTNYVKVLEGKYDDRPQADSLDDSGVGHITHDATPEEIAELEKAGIL